MSELLSRQEILQKNALVHLMIESDFIKSLLQVPTQELVINERFLWQEMQVLLEGLADKVLAQRLEQAFLGGLTLEEGQHAPRDTHDWEVCLFLLVMLRCPLHDSVHLGQVLLIFKALF